MGHLAVWGNMGARNFPWFAEFLIRCSSDAALHKLQLAMKTTSLSLFVSAVFLSVVCHAETQRDADRAGGGPKKWERGRFMPAWKQADKNQDGSISPDEFHAMLRVKNLPEEKRAKLFKRLDKNADGLLGREELARIARPSGSKGDRMRRLWELDRDRSGGVSIEEFREGRFYSKLPAERQRNLFARLDTDGDGEITAKDRPKMPRPGDDRCRQGGRQPGGRPLRSPDGGHGRRPPPTPMEAE